MLFKYPDEVVEIVRNAIKNHPSDVPASIHEAEVKIKKLPNYMQFVSTLICDAISNLVQTTRMQSTKAVQQGSSILTKPKKVNQNTGTAKVIPGKGTTVNAVARKQLFDEWFIAGKCLGDVYGREIEGLIEMEEKVFQGHKNHYARNTKILTYLQPLVPDDKMVRYAVSAKELTKYAEDNNLVVSGV
jgi:hypothetical protein